jgi:DNA-directed RNA polymerase specialized sigma24 family protein
VSLSHDDLERLLASLDADRERAGEAYERIRRKLIQFFEWRGAETPEDLADQTMDRVSAKIVGGETIRSNDPSLYFYGVARNILKEHWTAQKRELAALRGIRASPSGPPPSELADLARRLLCLERCLTKLPLNTRDLMIRYYQGQKESKIENRKQIAGELGVAMAALRNRTQRLRAKLESCVDDCLRRSSDMDRRFFHKRREETVR